MVANDRPIARRARDTWQFCRENAEYDPHALDPR